MPYPRLCAHRGFNTIAPENSLPALGAAVALGADEIEIDVRATADGVPVVCHDPSIDRCSDGQGSIAEMTYRELLRYDFGIRFAPSFEGLRIPRFEDILRQFPRQAIVNLHLKSSDGEPFSRAMMQRIAELIRTYDCSGYVYIMACAEVLDVALEVDPDVPRCLAAARYTPEEQIAAALELRCSKVQFVKTQWSPAAVAAAHGQGLRCNMFWSDEAAEARAMLEAGIDTLLTNDYQRINLVRKEFLARASDS